MNDVGRGPWAVGREEPNPVLLRLSRALEVVNGAVRLAYATGLLRVHRAPVPVISVGNIAVGGTGKTPLVAALARCLLASGARPAVLTRGYRRRDSRPRLVMDEPSARWEEIGDEPAVLARELPGIAIVVDADRVRGAATAVAATGATHLVLDDGFQHWRLARDLDIVTLDAADPVGLRRFRREHPRALAHATAAVVIGSSEDRLTAVRAATGVFAPGLRLFPCHLRATGLTLGRERHESGWLEGRRVLAFAGIARPERFAATLAELGAQVVHSWAFPDHHVLTEREVAAVLARAAELDAIPVTTAKDAVKLDAAALDRIAFLTVELKASRGDFLDLLAPVLAGTAPPAKRG